MPADYYPGDIPRVRVVQRALDLIAGVHNAFVSDAIHQESVERIPGEAHDSALEDARRRRALHALLDLVSFEGIYPCLSNGVGIPLEKRVISVLPVGVVAKQASGTGELISQDKHLLVCILDSLNKILQDGRSSIQPILLGRILPDIVCGIAELIFAFKNHTYSQTDQYRSMLDNVIDK